MRATVASSRYEEFVQLPMQTWSTGMPAISRTVPMLSGLWGFAASGTSPARSMSTTLSYCASESASSSTQSASRCSAAKKRRVMESLGKTDVVRPSSAPMLAMVARSGTVRPASPSPPYSKTRPTLPRVVKMSRSFKITSLAETQGGSFPVRFTRTTRGQVR